MTNSCAKLTVIALCLILIFSMLGGCRGPASDAGNVTSETSGTTVLPTPEPSKTPVPTPAEVTETTAAPFEYSWDPYVFSQIDREAIGAEAELFSMI